MKKIEWETPQVEVGEVGGSIIYSSNKMPDLSKTPPENSTITTRYKGIDIRLRVIDNANLNEVIAEILCSNKTQDDLPTDLTEGEITTVPKNKIIWRYDK